MLNWLRPKPLLDAETACWLFDLYAWALQHFDAGLFMAHTPLVTPSDRFFPGRADNPQAMAELILGHVQRHAALGHWPCQAVDYRSVSAPAPQRLAIAGDVRQHDAAAPDNTPADQHLLVRYDPAMLNNPEALIASFAHLLANALAHLAPAPPPGGEENWPHATEVLAVFLGFGVFMANSAGNVRIRRCGSCAPPPVDRQTWLSQYDITYALAIFCALKGVPASQVTGHLKAPLRGWFRRALKEVGRQPGLLALRQATERQGAGAPA